MAAMDIEYALIADYAEMVGGKLYLMGGGWDTFTQAEVPAQLRLSLAIGVRVGWEETNNDFPVRVLIEDDDGHELVRIEASMNVGRPPTVPPGSRQLAQLAANVPLTVTQHGGYRIVIRAGADEAATSERILPFRVARAR